MTNTRPSSTQPLFKGWELCVGLAAATAISGLYRLALLKYPAWIPNPTRRWGTWDALDLTTLHIFQVVIFMFILFRVVPRWAAQPEAIRIKTSCTIAVICALSLFGEHWFESRLNSVVAPLKLFLWSSSIAVGATPFVDYAVRRWSLFDRTYGLVGAAALAVWLQIGLVEMWYQGLASLARPMNSLDALEKTLMVINFVGPPLVVGFVMWFVFSTRHKTQNGPTGKIYKITYNGYPAVAWSQIVGTSQSVAGDDAAGRFKLYLGLIAVGALIGLSVGLEGMVLGAMLAAWLGGLGLRGAGKFVLQGEALGFVDKPKTDEERREEITPVTMRQDCHAFIEEEDGELWFCVGRGDLNEGPLPTVERVPWDSVSNFEEGSHKQWFRGRGAPSELADWGVIVAQTSVGRVVKVGESVYEHAWLVELLVTLQNTFIAPRDEMIRKMHEAAKMGEREQQKSTDTVGSDTGAVPNRPF